MNRSHLSDQELSGYLHHTLTDVDRESFDRHLALCGACSTRLRELRQFQESVRLTLGETLGEMELPSGVSFRQLDLPAGRRMRKPRALEWQTMVSGLSALVGLLLVMFSAYMIVRYQTFESQTVPLLGCFFLTVPLVSNYRRRDWLTSLPWISAILSAVLWVGVASVGLYEIYLVQLIVSRVVSQFSADAYLAVSLSSAAILVMSMIWIVLVIGNADYTLTHLGERRSWRLFGKTIAFQIFILLIPLLF
ncbi:MAG: zf-HC2 domain-containing protein [Anaerolineaceae bacterium]|nr:zf-HC2 domain-containing protein [Anaerolineaceae bacterium]